MTPQEKAEELVDNIYQIIGKNYSKGDGFSLQLTEEAKQCALICVDEIINELYLLVVDDFDYHKINIEYWEAVKQEIEKL